MLARQPGPYVNIARRWLALAERRQAHVVELRDSGRWRHYYTWEQLLDALREAVNSRDRWARIAGFEDGERRPDIDLMPPSADAIAADR
jgi:uncharacterized repeat protein (TIGR03809 family)